MKIVTSILLSVLCLSPETMKAMDSPSNNDSIVYVWDFSVNDASIKDIGNMLTDDFETELINSGLYTVLERRHYNRVLSHRNLENRIANIQTLPTASKDSLKANKAGVVIFGVVRDDINSGVYEVTVTFQRLDEIILRKGSVLIGRGLIADNQTRKNFMKDLVDRVHEKERMVAKKEQYELVSKVLATYMGRVIEVQKDFQDIALMAFDNEKYFENLSKTIFDYNDIFDELHNNGAKYVMDFTTSWDENGGRELEVIIENIMNDIHKTYILKLDKVKIAIWEYNTSTLKKSEKKKRRNEINKNIKETTDDLRRQIDIIDQKINAFLSNLKDEMRMQG